MFGFGKKSMIVRMEGLENIAQTIVYVKLLAYIRVQVDNENDAAIKAAAWANYLFGKLPNPKHRHMNLDKEYLAAKSWLSENDHIRELVVQSLRVANVISYAKNDTTLCGMDILESFGAEISSAPDAANYKELVSKFFSSLPSEQPQSIRAYLGC